MCVILLISVSIRFLDFLRELQMLLHGARAPFLISASIVMRYGVAYAIGTL